MGPFASAPVFVSVTKKMNDNEIVEAASYAMAIAALVLFTFLFFGNYILSAFMIDFNSLRVGGRIILAILGVELALGFSVLGERNKYSPAVVLLGTPLLTGPGVIVTTLIFVGEYGYLTTTIGALVALFLSWLTLVSSKHLIRALKEPGVEILSTVTGILLVAVAVNFITSGLAGMF